MASDVGLTTSRRYPGLGNGNLTALVNNANGSLAAAYEYDPYGNALRSSGRYAKENPFRFCTKYYDVETGLSNYGFRYYSASLGRFINRDPLEERGGWTLFKALRFGAGNSFSGAVAVGGDSFMKTWQERQDALVSNASLAHSAEGVHFGVRSNSTLRWLSESQKKFYSGNATSQENQGGSGSSEFRPDLASGISSPGAGNSDLPLYTYSGNDPINRFDAYGLEGEKTKKDESAEKAETVVSRMMSEGRQTITVTAANGNTGTLSRNKDGTYSSVTQVAVAPNSATGDSQMRDALGRFFKGSSDTSLTFGPNDPWTARMQQHSHVVATRENIIRQLKSGTATIGKPESAPYSLDQQSVMHNTKALLRDAAAALHLTDASYSTGSFRMRYTITGVADGTASVSYVLNDALRLGSASRIPFTDKSVFQFEAATFYLLQADFSSAAVIMRADSSVVDNVGGDRNVTFNNINLQWNWTETVRY